MPSPESEVVSEDVRIEVRELVNHGIVRTRLCPYCGHWYKVSNPELKVRSATTAADGRVLDDLHLVRCAGDRGLVPGRAPRENPGPGDGADRHRRSGVCSRACVVCGRKYLWCPAMKRKARITLPGGVVLDDVHRLRCARDRGLITAGQYRQSAKPPGTVFTPELSRRIWESRRKKKGGAA